jgi:peptidoglycan-associated lipoprotein
MLALAACSSLRAPLDGAATYELKQYSTAPDLLQKEYETEKDPAKKKEKALQIAQSYRLNNRIPQAALWYQKLTALGDEPAYYELGKMQMMQEQYDSALRSFGKYATLDASSKLRAQREIKGCQNAIEWRKAFTKLQVTNLQAINSPYADYSPVLLKGRLYFSSSRTEAEGEQKNSWTGEKSADLFMTDLANGGAATRLDAPITSSDYEGTCAFGKDGNDLYFTRCKVLSDADKKNLPKANEFCHIYVSHRQGGGWSEPEMLRLFADTINVGHPALSKDGKTLFVSSDLRDGFGGKDLYYFTQGDSGWVGPNNAGSAINTSGNEVFPWLDERSNLYYASDGMQGMGGLDIYKATKGKNIWKDPQNLRSPINSGGDDFGMAIEKYRPVDKSDTILQVGYFTSTRAGGKGEDDIYRYEQRWVNYFTLRGKALAKRYEDPENPDSKMLGIDPLSGTKIELKNLATDYVIATTVTDAGGNYTFTLDAETDYKLTAGHVGYFNKNETATTRGLRNQDSTYLTVYRDLELDKIFTKKDIVIPNIYYDLDKATLRPESQVVLDSILIFFNDNKDLIIEIGSHTDSRGSDAYNLKLSQARAQSVVDYLILKGVAKDRLVAVGYGETKLVNKCTNGIDCTEEEQQKNRRTTFRITGSKQVIESIEPTDIPQEKK